jgi:hypothetical protein
MEEYLKLDVSCELNSFCRSIEKQRYSIRNETPKQLFERRKTQVYVARKRVSSPLPLSKECKTLERKIEKQASKKRMCRSVNNKSLNKTKTPPTSTETSPLFKSINSYYNIEEDAII